MEKSFAGFPRSYPDGMGIDENDALAYSPAGFIWDHARAHKISIRNYGEFMGPAVRWRDGQREGTPDFLACFRAWRDKTDDVIFESWHSVESLREFSPTEYVGWEMSVPDQYRADFIIRELKDFASRQGGLGEHTVQHDEHPADDRANPGAASHESVRRQRRPHALLRDDALVSASLNFREVDRAPENVINRILWRSVRGAQIPYPEWAVTSVEDDDREEESSFEGDGENAR